MSEDWNTVGGAYGKEETKVLFESINLHKEAVKGKSVLVVGSETPWIESILLAIGANHVTTMEYNKIRTTHPKVNKFLSPLTNILYYISRYVLTIS